MRTTSRRSHKPMKTTVCLASRVWFVAVLLLLCASSSFVAPSTAAAQSPQFRYERRLTREALPHYRVSASVSVDAEAPSGGYSQRIQANTGPVVRYTTRVDRANSLSMRAPRPR